MRMSEEDLVSEVLLSEDGLHDVTKGIILL